MPLSSTTKVSAAVDLRSESNLGSEEIAEFVIISLSDGERDFNDHSSSALSSTDSDASSSDEVFTSSKHYKENNPMSYGRNSIYYEGRKAGLFSGRGKEYHGGEELYRRRRQRNNAAVKRSRDKARQRQKESQRYLAELTAENRRLQMKADVLLKELSLLRGLFPSVGDAGPKMLLEDVDAILVESQ